MTALRKRMLEELQRRNYSPTTIRAYLHAVETFARHFGKSPDKLDQEHLRQYQLHLLHDHKLTVGTIVSNIAALRFFFVRVHVSESCYRGHFSDVKDPKIGEGDSPQRLDLEWHACLESGVEKSFERFGVFHTSGKAAE